MTVHERLTTHHSIRLLLVAEAGCNRNDRYNLGCVRLGTGHRWGIAVDGRSLHHIDPADGLTFSKTVFVLVMRENVSILYSKSSQGKSSGSVSSNKSNKLEAEGEWKTYM
jgi:hypothetical protein